MNEDRAEKEFAIKKDERPRTRFVDNLNAIEVDMIDYPDANRLKRVLVNMPRGSWYKDYIFDTDPLDVQSAHEDVLNGNVLGQAMEHPKFCFVVSGLSLHGTHAMVRNRIGICYIQQSHAVKDLRHEDVLVPRAFTKHPSLLAEYKEWVRQGKEIYADLMDTGDIATTDARFCLPKTIPSWLYVSVNLAALLAIYAKRSDTQEEHPELNISVELMKARVVTQFPFLSGSFKSACEQGRCLHQRKGYMANCVFKRNSSHGMTGEDNWTLHDKTKRELMLECKPYQDDPEGSS